MSAGRRMRASLPAADAKIARALLPQYGYGGPSGVSHGYTSYGDAPYGPMTKRRRVDDGSSGGDSSGADEAGFAEWCEPPSQQHQQHFPSVFHGGAYGGGPHHHDQVVAHGLHESSEHPNPGAAHWSSSGASPYPDVSSYQQPYFYQQTDPSIYTSPWPPAQDVSAPFSASTGNYTHAIPVPVSMPFFPTTQAQAVQTDAFDVGTEGYQSYQELNPGSQYGYAVNQTRVEPPRPASAYYYEDASMHLKMQSLSILDDLATQLIHTIAKASFAQIQDLMRSSEAEESQAYSTLKNLFDQTRKVYSRETAFIDAISIQMFQPSQQEIIRKANIATFISSILGAHDVSFFHLNEFFVETFVPLGHRLLKWQGAIYLELKTQTYISALMNSDGSPEAMLAELFPSDLDAQILTRHPDAPSLSPSEQDFIDRSKARKSYLLAEPSTDEAARELPNKYQWNDFVREFASCISKNVEAIMNAPMRAQPIFSGAVGDKRAPNATQTVQDTAVGQQTLLARNGAQAAGTLNAAGAPVMPSRPQQANEKKAGTASTVRQPWTKPEEDALLEGLGKVSGPHWSQILALYGRGGSVSEVLKDRNQVQLKDKARNLKLWYLKMGREVPVALRGVTGELRKRGGARARAALELEEEDQGAGAGAGAADADGEEVVGGNIDPNLEVQQVASRPAGRKKGGGRK
ncbi:hypothetical protein LTR36_004312 [Oleoguttula mirabilis]|uniref:Telomere repeat-binding factor dimerisation domain-containing protein n=1 Tax=Oleoguttula mirabilis TaxID=1507867 RepID=A0AAV9JGW3_9PEZI|nr:hypothetical protein LTR36_004312 [Oleoguttula mirabilis]